MAPGKLFPRRGHARASFGIAEQGVDACNQIGGIDNRLCSATGNCSPGGIADPGAVLRTISLLSGTAAQEGAA